jgi:hypothetical protein
VIEGVRGVIVAGQIDNRRYFIPDEIGRPAPLFRRDGDEWKLVAALSSPIAVQ